MRFFNLLLAWRFFFSANILGSDKFDFLGTDEKLCLLTKIGAKTDILIILFKALIKQKWSIAHCVIAQVTYARLIIDSIIYFIIYVYIVILLIGWRFLLDVQKRFFES